MANHRICTIRGCGKPHKALGLCGMHRQRLRKHGDPHYTKFTAPGEKLRFLEHQVMPYSGDDCMFWPFPLNGNGYAEVKIKGLSFIVSRLVCADRHGDPDDGLEAAHSCGNGHLGCVSGNHLSWKTRAENVQDMFDHGTAPLGADKADAKLTDDQILEIRAIGYSMTLAALARRFNVAPSTIHKVRVGTTWKHII